MKCVGIGIVLALALSACPRGGALTAGEAQQALEESAAASQAEGLMGTSADLATSFTLGAGVEQSVDELRAFLAAQLPCAEVSIEGATLTVTYGVNPGTCTYRGHELSGVARITISSNGEEDGDMAFVEHEWLALSNGLVSLDGTATVAWDFAAQTRRVTHETRWTSLRTGRVVEGAGDRVQQRVSEDGVAGIRVDGSRSWEGERGSWELDIDGVRMRWADPIPDMGTYTLSTPFDKTLSMSFARVDEDTIRVTVASGERDFDFTVSKLGVVERQER
jgi:hypothetical protein